MDFGMDDVERERRWLWPFRCGYWLGVAIAVLNHSSPSTADDVDLWC